MKLNIKKLQIGGVIFDPTDASVQASSSSGAAQPSSKRPEKDPIDEYTKDMRNQLIGKGLINEVNMFSASYQEDLRAYEALPESAKESYQGKMLRRKLQGDMGKLNELVKNQDAWNKSYDTMKSNNTQSTAATIGENFVIKNAKGQITTISFDQYSREDDGSLYKVLTTSELLNERNRNPYLAFDTEAIDIAKEIKSPEYYAKVVEEFASKASGGGDTRLITEGYLTAREAQAIKTISGSIEKGVYKTSREVIENSNKEQLDLSLQAAVKMIGPSGLTTLKAKFLREGVDSKEVGGKIEEYLVSLTYPKLKIKKAEQDKIAFDSAASKGTGAGGGSGSDKVANLGEFEAAAVGRINKDNFLHLSKDLSISAPMYRLPERAISDANNKKKLIGESGLNDITLLEKATTPDGLPVDINQAIMTNSYVTKLPMTEEGGKLVLDIEGSKKVSQYNAALKNAGLDKAYMYMSDAEKIELENIRIKYGYRNWSGKLMDVVVGQAISYDPNNWFDWSSERSDSPYYEKASKAEIQALKAATTDGVGARNWLDNPIRKHLVIIPAKDQGSFRFADKEKLRVDRNDVMMEQYTGAPGSSLHGEQSIRELEELPNVSFSYEDL